MILPGCNVGCSQDMDETDVLRSECGEHFFRLAHMSERVTGAPAFPLKSREIISSNIVSVNETFAYYGDADSHG
jgi:hypothetical protein